MLIGMLGFYQLWLERFEVPCPLQIPPQPRTGLSLQSSRLRRSDTFRSASGFIAVPRTVHTSIAQGAAHLPRHDPERLSKTRIMAALSKQRTMSSSSLPRRWQTMPKNGYKVIVGGYEQANPIHNRQPNHSPICGPTWPSQ
jgi:hypothetical protein